LSTHQAEPWRRLLFIVVLIICACAGETSAQPAEEPAPAADPAPGPEPITEDDDAAVYAQARSAQNARVAKWKAHKNKAMLAPQMSLFLGGQQVRIFDAGWGSLGDVPRVDSFSGGFDIWAHPNIAVSLAWSDSNTVSDSVSDDTEAASLNVTGRIRSFDGGAKAALAPRWMPVRPIVRAAFGVRTAEVEVQDGSVSSNLKGRQASGAAPYGKIGGGLEIVTPRYFGTGWQDKNAVKSIRWGAGFLIEGGAEIGGGGDVPAASSIDLGEFGRLDVGPWYFRAGLLIFF
ncbi:MAG: hypothetical protein KDA24_27540, partial [Deltaproteobacteria bacterium]|nr:hypothetical protein [Deltaproteobacteria bacterium]